MNHQPAPARRPHQPGAHQRPAYTRLTPGTAGTVTRYDPDPGQFLTTKQAVIL